ncbi:hypothetical protein [Metaclostridioides mangenotii]|uniref:hypothetical protein n=1 Tax=Metaclostridioides mangenotii TaxID=1540 RepID=UPI00046545B5|nr:hypothetical protein [Clostridioides mangenotii]
MYKLTKDEDGMLTTNIDCPVCENKFVFIEGDNGSINIDDRSVVISAKCTECGHKEKYESEL